MKILLTLLVAFSLILTLSVNAQTDPVMQKIVEIGQADNQVMDHLDILCNRFGGRLIGSVSCWVRRG
jgi:carboxypeptidase Q